MKMHCLFFKKCLCKPLSYSCGVILITVFIKHSLFDNMDVLELSLHPDKDLTRDVLPDVMFSHFQAHSHLKHGDVVTGSLNVNEGVRHYAYMYVCVFV